jgi:RNAse (barnase) inhibitor barstar
MEVLANKELKKVISRIVSIEKKEGNEYAKLFDLLTGWVYCNTKFSFLQMKL